MKKVFLGMFALAALAACSPKQDAQQDQVETATETSSESEAEETRMTFPADSVSSDSSMSFHGMRINTEGAVDIAEIPALIASNPGQAIKVSGKIDACCQAKGCWMTMTVGDQEMRVKFQDYGFFVPLNSGGKMATMEGVATLDTTSVDDLVHYAMDGGMSQEEAEAKYTEPRLDLNFLATGVVIEDM
ncbi:DUF4920 domain-containing protein [Pontibacter sp. G13]|uniref:DUF4920 domain-containing protein n=1 Tax=Pontibacter sp. G13 TaxID=3074898 RepID=UPI00288A9ACA|nr:DUF4920 domain-containing protein [Pontibacter sp. G13]WNJ21257.1 DUF4920 domain-containing protein [Pontibacter sp. G13]